MDNRGETFKDFVRLLVSDEVMFPSALSDIAGAVYCGSQAYTGM